MMIGVTRMEAQQALQARMAKGGAMRMGVDGETRTRMELETR